MMKKMRAYRVVDHLWKSGLDIRSWFGTYEYIDVFDNWTRPEQLLDGGLSNEPGCAGNEDWAICEELNDVRLRLHGGISRIGDSKGPLRHSVPDTLPSFPMILTEWRRKNVTLKTYVV